MKTAVSYVSGTAGDFVVNCCNHVWTMKSQPQGCVTVSSSMKHVETGLNDADWLRMVNALPHQHVGTHLIDRLLRTAVVTVWLTVSDCDSYHVWARRDCVTRPHDKLLAPFGMLFETIRDLILSQRRNCAARAYLDWITRYNWNQMQMRQVQLGTKINVTALLTHKGMDDVIDQLPQLQSVQDQCREYHALWLTSQVDLTECNVIDLLGHKLHKFVTECEDACR